MFHPKDPLVVYKIQTKWLLNLHVKKHMRNIMRMGTHKIIKQIGKFDLKY